MLIVCLSNIALYPALYNFPIDMREMCERPGIQCASLSLSVNWGKDSVHAVFYGSFLS